MNATTKTIKLDRDLRTFLQEVMNCQSPGLAAWATQIAKAGHMTLADLERCLNLGFSF